MLTREELEIQLKAFNEGEDPAILKDLIESHLELLEDHEFAKEKIKEQSQELYYWANR